MNMRFIWGEGDFVRLRTLYVKRRLLNADAVRVWAASQGIASALPADDMHATIAFSRDPVDWSVLAPERGTVVVEAGARAVRQFPPRTTPNGALVLKFESGALRSRWQYYRDAGASWDYPEYQPHITITYSVAEADVSGVEPYSGPLIFGLEELAEVDEGWAGEVREEPTVEKAYDPNQPRKPRGDPEGGQWAPQGGGVGVEWETKSVTLESAREFLDYSRKAIKTPVLVQELDVITEVKMGQAPGIKVGASMSINVKTGILYINDQDMFGGAAKLDKNVSLGQLRHELGHLVWERARATRAGKEFARAALADIKAGRYLSSGQEQWALRWKAGKTSERVVLHESFADWARFGIKHDRYLPAQHKAARAILEKGVEKTAPLTLEEVYWPQDCTKPCFDEDLDKAYDPDQPREPAGTAEGGQWAPQGGGGRVVGGDLILYHGTTSKVLASIKKEGLVPGGGPGADAWLMENVELGNVQGEDIRRTRAMIAGRPTSVFFARNPKHAREYANLVSEYSSGNPVLLKVTFPKGYRGLKTRRAGGSGFFRVEGRIKPEWIEVVSGKELRNIGKSDGEEVYVLLFVDDEPNLKEEPRSVPRAVSRRFLRE